MASRNPWLNSPSIPFDLSLIDPLLTRDESGALQGREKDFWHVFQSGVRPIPPSIAAVTGHVAESLVPVLLERAGYTPVMQLVGPGLHGVDLLLLDPAETGLVAVEVKGTLRSNGWPRLSSGGMEQMSREWLSGGNAGMAEWGLHAEDVIGLAVAVALSRGELRMAKTLDFATWLPVQTFGQLTDLSSPAGRDAAESYWALR